jgi:hypothetical protein
MAKAKYKVSYVRIATGKRDFVRAPNGDIRHYSKDKAERIVKLLKPRDARMMRV